MGSREEALRRIFEATGVAGRLSDDQKRELLAHVEDAVDAKVAAGASEMDAVGQSFAELGDLEKIARQFPAAAAVAVTPEGARVPLDTNGIAWMALCFLGFFTALGWFVTPRFAAIFQQLKVPMPTMTMLFVKFGDLMRSTPAAPAVALLLIFAVAAILRRRRVPPAAAYGLLLVAAGLCVGLAAGLFLPLLSLLEGVSSR